MNDSVSATIEAYHILGKRNGSYTSYMTINGKRLCREKSNYINDTLHGKCAKIEDSNAIFCTYNHGILEGPYKEYFCPRWIVFPNEATIDTVGIDFMWVSEGQYSNNEKCGHWKTYWMHPKRRIGTEGEYKNNEREGVWKTYFPNILDYVKNAADYEGKVMNYSNYVNGKLDGESIGYFSVKDSLIVDEYEVTTYKNGKKESIVLRDTIGGNLIYKAHIFPDDTTSGVYVFKDGDGYSRGTCTSNKKTATWYYHTQEPDLTTTLGQDTSRLSWLYDHKERIVLVKNDYVNEQFYFRYSYDTTGHCQCDWTYKKGDSTFIYTLEVSPKVLSSIPQFIHNFDFYLQQGDSIKYNGSVKWKDQLGREVLSAHRNHNGFYGIVEVVDFNHKIRMSYDIEKQNYKFLPLYGYEPFSGTYRHKVVENDNIYIIENVKNGFRHGKIKEHDLKTNQLLKESTYKYGRLHGTTTYYVNNQKVKSEKYKNGILVSTKTY